MGSGQRSSPAPFLMKTYQMVEDGSTNEVISWNESGTTFVVWCPAGFAKDLLPTYFKHNNFSSFVRQLNTYGFHKIVPERWEFSNEFFRQGQKELLCQIRRRKKNTISRVQISGGEKPNNAGEDLGSTSTSSHDSKNYGSDETTTNQFSDLSDENEKLRRDNRMLSSEIVQTKKQCEELIEFLSKFVNVGPDLINRFVKQGHEWSSHDRLVEEDNIDSGDDNEKGNEDEYEEEENCLKLFGVWLKGNNNKKRGGDESVVGGPALKEMKMVDFDVSWMKISSSSRENSKVCN